MSCSVPRLVVGRFRAEIRDAAARNKASAIALVGSVARGDAASSCQSAALCDTGAHEQLVLVLFGDLSEVEEMPNER